jgi:hypothetical protein
MEVVQMKREKKGPRKNKGGVHTEKSMIHTKETKRNEKGKIKNHIKIYMEQG